MGGTPLSLQSEQNPNRDMFYARAFYGRERENTESGKNPFCCRRRRGMPDGEHDPPEDVKKNSKAITVRGVSATSILAVVKGKATTAAPVFRREDRDSLPKALHFHPDRNLGPMSLPGAEKEIICFTALPVHQQVTSATF
jgi:hypothetical protein